MAEITFTNHYRAGHSYDERWATTDYHCPACGEKKVWENQSGGDYYVGTQLICTACSFSFYMPAAKQIEGQNPDDNDMQRLAALRAAQT
jgi:predicted RNA-binding Zn-ribbon protein involved in translation (DUF1610 family)